MAKKITISFFIFLFSLICAQAEVVYTILKGQNIQIHTGYQTPTLCSNTLWKGEYLDGSNAQSTISCLYCLNPMMSPTKTAIYTFNIPNVITMTIRIIVIANIQEIAQLNEVYFHDKTDNNQKTNFFPIRRDDNGEYYANENQPYWTSSGVAHPIAYVSGTKMYVSSKINIDGTKSLSEKVKIRGLIFIKDTKIAELPMVDYNINKFSTTNTIDYKKVSANTALLPNKIIYDPSFKIKWEISFDAGANWSEFSVSSNELYVLWKKPENEIPNEFMYLHTLLYLSCKANDNQLITGEQNILNNIWNLFKRDNLENNTALSKKNGVLLKYYGTPNTQNVNSYMLINDQNSNGGQCYAFSSLFIDLQAIQGSKLVSYSQNHKIVIPKYYEIGDPHRFLCDKQNPIAFFFVKNWSFNGVGRNRTICNDLPFVMGSKTDPISMTSSGGMLVSGEALKNSGISGQNNPNPNSFFAAHSHVLINGIIYDASYGKTYTNELEFRDNALSGWADLPALSPESKYNIDTDGDNIISTTQIFYYYRCSNNLSIWEIK